MQSRIQGIEQDQPLFREQLRKQLPEGTPISFLSPITLAKNPPDKFAARSRQNSRSFVHHLRNLRRERNLRSEEHTSELQSRLHLVCRLLLEKKNKTELLDVGQHAVQCRPVQQA